jgi:hypothetical protein
MIFVGGGIGRAKAQARPQGESFKPHTVEGPDPEVLRERQAWRRAIAALADWREGEREYLIQEFGKEMASKVFPLREEL